MNRSKWILIAVLLMILLPWRSAVADEWKTISEDCIRNCEEERSTPRPPPDLPLVVDITPVVEEREAERQQAEWEAYAAEQRVREAEREQAELAADIAEQTAREEERQQAKWNAYVAEQEAIEAEWKQAALDVGIAEQRTKEV